MVTPLYPDGEKRDHGLEEGERIENERETKRG